MKAQMKPTSLRAAASAWILAALLTGCLEEVSGDTDGPNSNGPYSNGPNTEPGLKDIDVNVNFSNCTKDQKDKVDAAYRRAINAFSSAYATKTTQDKFEDTTYYPYFKNAFGADADRATVQSTIVKLYETFALQQLQLKCGCSKDVEAKGGVATAATGTGGGTIGLCSRFFTASKEIAGAALIHEVGHAYLNLGHFPVNVPVKSADKYQIYLMAILRGYY